MKNPSRNSSIGWIRGPDPGPTRQSNSPTIGSLWAGPSLWCYAVVRPSRRSQLQSPKTSTSSMTTWQESQHRPKSKHPPTRSKASARPVSPNPRRVRRAILTGHSPTTERGGIHNLNNSNSGTVTGLGHDNLTTTNPRSGSNTATTPGTMRGPTNRDSSGPQNPELWLWYLVVILRLKATNQLTAAGLVTHLTSYRLTSWSSYPFSMALAVSSWLSRISVEDRVLRWLGKLTPCAPQWLAKGSLMWFTEETSWKTLQTTLLTLSKDTIHTNCVPSFWRRLLLVPIFPFWPDMARASLATKVANFSPTLNSRCNWRNSLRAGNATISWRMWSCNNKVKSNGCQTTPTHPRWLLTQQTSAWYPDHVFGGPESTGLPLSRTRSLATRYGGAPLTSYPASTLTPRLKPSRLRIWGTWLFHGE